MIENTETPAQAEGAGGAASEAAPGLRLEAQALQTEGEAQQAEGEAPQGRGRISAAQGEGIDRLLEILFSRMEEGPPIYPIEDFTTQPERFYAAEIVREKVLRYTSEELPFTTAVHVDRFEEEDAKNLIKIYATIFVERETQKPIVIGKRGERIKQIGTEARLDLESFLGAKVFLDLHVGVHERWREDERFLGELEWPLS